MEIKTRKCGGIKEFKCDRTLPETKQFFYLRKDGICTSYCKDCACKYNNTDARRRVIRNATLKRKYKISIEEFEQLLEQQNYVCYLCEKEETKIIAGKLQPLSVDHCHSTGTVRKLVCHDCNLVVALIENKNLASIPDYCNKVQKYIRNEETI